MRRAFRSGRQTHLAANEAVHLDQSGTNLPARLYVAPMYGYKSLKWLASIELTKEVEAGYWEERGYDVDGWVGRSNGRSDDAT